ncbi:cytochrome P450 [Xylariaceae sp. FL0804]|nr:cytochrome P450 [Xylariaceae sp. FL0804]
MAALWILLTVAVSVVAVYRLLQVGKRPANYPPGPPTLPILGNLHLMPKERGHVQFKKWAEEYGPVYSLMLGTKVMIVLSSDKVVKDLLDKRSNIYSSRPEIYVAQLVSGVHKVKDSLRVLLMPHGDRWRAAHRIYHSILNINTAKSMVPYQDLENKQMMAGLLDEPDNFRNHIRRYTHSLTSQMIYGWRSKDLDNPAVVELFHNLHQFSLTMDTTTAALLDMYPPMRQLPDFLLPTRQHAKRLHEIELASHLKQWRQVKRQLKEGTAKSSLCVPLIKAQEKEGFSDEQAAYIAGNLLEAGSDTTAAQLNAFVQAMLIFPDVQRRAQEEIDRVCGDRLPTMDDEPNLPYTRSCVKETNRWMPTAILGISHANTVDDEYMGYKIPKNSTVVLNVWAIHMDEKRHKNPSAFDPSRYLDDPTSSMESAQSRDPARRDQFVFGAGRRICQGMHIADRSMFLGISRLLWGFDINRAHRGGGGDEEEEEVVPDAGDLIEGMLVQPRPFPAKITPRSARRAEVIRREWADCQSLLSDDFQWRETPAGMPMWTYEPADDEKE